MYDMHDVQMYNTDISSLPVATDLDVEGVLSCIWRIEIGMFLPGEVMTGCLDELMEKASQMGLDECWDEVSDEDKQILEPIFRWNPQNYFKFCPKQIFPNRK